MYICVFLYFLLSAPRSFMPPLVVSLHPFSVLFAISGLLGIYPGWNATFEGSVPEVCDALMCVQ